MLRFLEALEAPPGGRTVVVAAGEKPGDEVTALLAHLPGETREAALRFVDRATTGAVLFWSPGAVHVVSPPFPVKKAGAWDGWRKGQLSEMLTARLTLGVVLVRLSGYAAGVFEGDSLVASKVGTAHVHGRHKAGGWSQQRFARRREKQARELYGRVCQAVTERFAPYGRTLDYVLLGGDRFTLQGFLAECPFLAGFGERLLERRLPVEQPNQAALEPALEQAWVSRVVSLGVP